jgi:hypothetical protein
MWRWLRDAFSEGTSSKQVLVSGTRLAEGTELVVCSMCFSVVPILGFTGHLRYHEHTLHAQIPAGDDD